MTAATRKVRSGLTEKQQHFVENMLGGMQPTDAYVEAYKPKMTRRRAGFRARDLLNHPRIIAAMAEAQEAAQSGASSAWKPSLISFSRPRNSPASASNRPP